MPLCFICKKSSPNIGSLCKHFQYKHANHNFIEYIYVENQCNRSYYLLNSFKKHLATIHYTQKPKLENNIQTSYDDNDLVSLNILNSNVNTSTDLTDLPSIQHLPVNNCNPNINEHQIQQFLASLYANSQIPRNVIQTFTEGITNIIKGIEGSLMNCPIEIPTNIINHITTTFQCFYSNFTNLNTEYKRIKYFTNLKTYVPPKEIVIGQRLNENRNKNIFSILPTYCTE